MKSVTANDDFPKLKTTHLFGEFLVSKGILSRLQLSKALDEQRRYGGRLGEALLRLGIMNEEQVTQSLAEHLSMEYFHFDDISRRAHLRGNVYL